MLVPHEMASFAITSVKVRGFKSFGREPVDVQIGKPKPWQSLMIPEMLLDIKLLL